MAGDGVTFVKIESQWNDSISKLIMLLIVGIHLDDGIVCASDNEMYEKFSGMQDSAGLGKGYRHY